MGEIRLVRQKYKKAKGEAQFVIPIDIFNSDVAVFDNADDLRLALKRHNVSDWNDDFKPSKGMALLRTSDNGTVYFALLLTKHSEVGTWAHEAAHIADFLMEEIGIPCTFGNTEIRAYLIGFITNAISRGLKYLRW